MIDYKQHLRLISINWPAEDAKGMEPNMSGHGKIVEIEHAMNIGYS